MKYIEKKLWDDLHAQTLSKYQGEISKEEYPNYLRALLAQAKEFQASLINEGLVETSKVVDILIDEITNAINSDIRYREDKIRHKLRVRNDISYRKMYESILMHSLAEIPL